jgi:CRP-like cAMP-binding protein
MREILEFCRDLPQREFSTEHTLIAEGSATGVLYILVRGSVEVLKGDFQVTTVSEPGAVFGEVSVLLGKPHMATVRTLMPSVFHVIDDPRAFFASHPNIAFAVATLLAKRLHSVTSYLVDLKRQFEGSGDHLGMVDEVLESLVHHQEEARVPGSDRDPDPTVY